jgi:hypothetical protein
VKEGGYCGIIMSNIITTAEALHILEITRHISDVESALKWGRWWWVDMSR